MAKPRILVIDDGLEYARIVAEHLGQFELITPRGPNAPAQLEDGPSALSYLAQHAFDVDVALLDVRFDVPEDRLLPLGDGVSLRRTKRFQGVAILRELRRLYPALPVVLLTAVEDLSLVDVDGELAAQSMTYFLDSDDLDTLRIRINAALQERALGLEDAGVLWGSDRAMQAIRRRLGVLARGAMPVILEGGTGTGKSFLAERFIHPNSGRPGPFVTVDLATIPKELVPAHLFGAVRGAYTGAVGDRKGMFELAHEGTLFIDEIQNVPLEMQKQLLLVLQNKRVRPLGAAREVEVDVKVIAGSNRPLAEAVAEGVFRQDLQMRLGPATRVVIPPLSERRGDLAFFARRFVERAADDLDNLPLRELVAKAAGLPAGSPVRLLIGRGRATEEEALTFALPKPSWQMLVEHPWPGNMRELSMVMHSLVTFTFVSAAQAIREGLPVRSPRLQIDPGLVGELLAASAGLPGERQKAPNAFGVNITPQETLNAVSTDLERQCYKELFLRTSGDFALMAEALLGDPDKARAVRLRFNQIGLKVRELRRFETC